MKDSASSKRGRMTRRAALKYAGVAAGAAAMPSVLLAEDQRRTRAWSRPVKVGLLLPAASLHPTMARSFTEGMAVSLSQIGGGSFELVREDATAHFPVSSYRKLVEEARVDLVVGLVNSSVASLLARQLQDAAVPFIAANLGENMLREDEHSSSVFHCTMNLWQSNWAMGRWAATYLGSRAFVVTSLYDSGYDALHAFRLGLESAGGEVIGTYVSNNGPGTEDVKSIVAEIGKSGAELTFALYSGASAEEFLVAYANAGLIDKIPLAGSAFLADERTLTTLGSAASGLFTPFSWAPTLGGAQSLSFSAGLKEIAGRPPDAFAILGHDVVELMLAAVSGGGHAERWLRSLTTAVIDSPRGRLRMNPETNSLVGPLYIREVRMTAGKPVNTIVDTVEAVSELDDSVRSLRTAVRSGWYNTYLCM